MNNLIKFVYLPDFNQTKLISPKMRKVLGEDRVWDRFQKYVVAFRDFNDSKNQGIGVSVGACFSNYCYDSMYSVRRGSGLSLLFFPLEKDRKVIFTPRDQDELWKIGIIRASIVCGDPTAIWAGRKGEISYFLFVQNPFLHPDRYDKPEEGRYDRKNILNRLFQDRARREFHYV